MNWDVTVYETTTIVTATPVISTETTVTTVLTPGASVGNGKEIYSDSNTITTITYGDPVVVSSTNNINTVIGTLTESTNTTTRDRVTTGPWSNIK